MSLVSLKEVVFWGWWSVSWWTRLGYFVDTMHLIFQSLSIILRCGGLQLNMIFSFSSAWWVQWPGFALIRVSCRCAINIMLLNCVCCTRLIRTRITVFQWASICFCQRSTYPRCVGSKSIRVWSIEV